MKSPGQNVDDFILLRAIESTYPFLKQWQARASKLPPEAPQRGSELGMDGEVFKQFPPWRMALLSLISSNEHLMVVRDTLNQRQLYNSATYTVLRGALVGASQAVWMLSPAAEDVRRNRGLAAIREMHKQLVTAQRDYLVEPLSKADRDDLTEQIRWLESRQLLLTEAMTSELRLIQTQVISYAAQHVFDKPELQLALRVLWRQMSGDAHVLGWSMLQRGEYRDIDRRTGMSTAVLTGDMRGTANAYLGVFRVLRAGWSLFDQRGEARARCGE